MTQEVCALPKPTSPVRLSDGLYVGPAPEAPDLIKLQAAGFRTIINNRPDTDQSLKLTSAEMAAQSAGLGIQYAHIPIEGTNPLEKDVKAFSDALNSCPHPIFAYCQSGGRSASLWALAAVGEHDTDTLITMCRNIGFDVSGLRTKMDMRREMLENGELDDD